MEGGVGELLVTRDPDTRTLYTDTGTGGALVPLVADNVPPAFFGVGTEAERDVELAYARGFAIDGNEQPTDAPREWILGDILHSQPLVISYGARVSPYTRDNPDLRLLVGTNAGFVHMFGSDNGQEDWAFLPQELGPNLPARRLDPQSPDHIYGMDLSPVAYLMDGNGDGNLRHTDGDKAYVYLGMRRGGSSLYALDVSNPDSPAALFTINRATTGFEELGDSWSKPQVTFIPGYRDGNGKPKPVLMFGAGYDVALDDTNGAYVPANPGNYEACNPVCGRGMYVVDATTGALLWSVTPGATSTTNLQAAGLEFPVAAEVTPIDSNGDGLTDRVYFADVGGHIWRVDIAGGELPSAMTSNERNCPEGTSRCLAHVNMVADLNGAVAAGVEVDGSADRRFFNAVEVVRSRLDGVAVDVLLIASGDRTNPNGRDVRNRFYVIRDKQTTAFTTRRPSPAECTAGAFDFRCQLPISEASDAMGGAGLLNVTVNPFTADDITDAQIIATLKTSNGWYIDLLRDANLAEGKFGEKGLAKSLTINGTIFLTTFVPRPEEGSVQLTDEDVCTPEAGSGYLYILDLFDARFVSIAIAPVIPDTPSTFFGEDGKISLLLPPGTPDQLVEGEVGNLDCAGGVCGTDFGLPGPYGNYWLEEDFQ
jgi:type IV pilus assembly protein PilY1